MTEKKGPDNRDFWFKALEIVGKIIDLLIRLVTLAGLILVSKGLNRNDLQKGGDSILNSLLDYIPEWHLDQIFLYLLMALLIFWALMERRLRKKKIRSMSIYIKELEKRLDPDRTSSDLTDTGDTNPED